MHEEKPSVYSLPVHLQDKQMVNFDDNDDLEEIMDHDAIKKTALTEWFTPMPLWWLQRRSLILTFPNALFGRKR